MADAFVCTSGCCPRGVNLFKGALAVRAAHAASVEDGADADG